MVRRTYTSVVQVVQAFLCRFLFCVRRQRAPMRAPRTRGKPAHYRIVRVSATGVPHRILLRTVDEHMGVYTSQIRIFVEAGRSQKIFYHNTMSAKHALHRHTPNDVHQPVGDHFEVRETVLRGGRAFHVSDSRDTNDGPVHGFKSNNFRACKTRSNAAAEDNTHCERCATNNKCVQPCGYYCVLTRRCPLSSE